MLSVIVPVYNTAPYLERTLAALAKQEYPRDAYEVICVDNGSSDGSIDILRRHLEIRVLEEPERSSYAARNRGIGAARGEILAFTDSDCFPSPHWLRSIERAFDEDRVQVLLGPRVPSVENVFMRLVSNYENDKVELVCASADPQLYFGHTNNMAVRREAMARFGPFVVRERGSDTIFVRAVVDALGCDAVAYAPQMVVQHAELESVVTYYRKIATYARSRSAYRHIATVRPLSQKERLRVFWRTASRGPVAESILLLLVLAGGSIAWWKGGLGVGQSDR